MRTPKPQRPPPVVRERRAPARRHGNRRQRTGMPVLAVLTALWMALLAWGIGVQRLPSAAWTLPAALLLNAVAFGAYAADKQAAVQQRWRTPEKTLHLLGLLGGWPAAGLAQQALCHKSSKPAFRTVYWLTGVLHCMALALWVVH